MKKITLTIQSVCNGFKSSKGNLGTAIFFEEKQTKGDFKGSNFMFWSTDVKYIPETITGWTYDEETDRIASPIVTQQSQTEAKLLFAHSLGMEIRL